MARQAGVLIPLFSLRASSNWGVGEIPDLVPFARWAASSGFSVIQLLPVNEVGRGENSPYSALSAFALDPVYLALDMVEDFEAAGGRSALSGHDAAALEAAQQAPSVEWANVRHLKARALDLAFRSFLDKEWKTRSARGRQLEAYVQTHTAWLDPYALFTAIHDDLYQGKSWVDWEPGLSKREPAALEAARARLSERVLYRCWVQWQLDLQWHAARRAANEAGVELMGDLPFMVSTDSADVWSRSFDFRLDARVGVPPDAFSETGQDWGLPVYRWDTMAENGFAWMNERARRNAELFGLYRVDHVVGLYRTYYRPNDGGPAAFIPEAEPEQIANGEQMISILSQGARVIAEDLGSVPGFVRASLTDCGVPGYRVLRWEKEWDEEGQPFRDPAGWPALSVATTGTHDTDSQSDWFDALTEKERTDLLQIPALARLRERAPERFDDDVRDQLLSAIYTAGSDLLLVPFQDAMGTRERVNVPGTVNDANWTYRMPMTIAALSADRPTRERLRGLASHGGRSTL